MFSKSMRVTTVQSGGSRLPSPGLGHLATSGTFLVISMGVGRCYSQGGLGVESGAAASPPFMHRTTAQQGRTPHKMSTVPKERNFGPK